VFRNWRNFAKNHNHPVESRVPPSSRAYSTRRIHTNLFSLYTAAQIRPFLTKHWANYRPIVVGLDAASGHSLGASK
jgi:hypothetical protein